MTPQDAFEAWWKSEIPMSLASMETEDRFKSDFKRCWLAACQFQLEQDRKVALSHCLEDGQVELCCGLEIEKALRATLGGKESHVK